MEATIASEAVKMAVLGNMHMDMRVFEVSDFKSEAKFDFLITVARSSKGPLPSFSPQST